jgi:hypothetical protein
VNQDPGSGSRVLMAKNLKKYSGKNVSFFIKNDNLQCFFLCLLKGRPGNRRSLQPSKENIQQLKK